MNEEETLDVSEEVAANPDVDTFDVDSESFETESTESEDVVPASMYKQKQNEAAKWQRLYHKAAKQPAQKAPAASHPSPAPADVEALVLQAQGMSDELLAQLKDVAAVRKVSLINAQKDPLFVAVKENFEKAEKTKAASLSASRGSSSPKPKVGLSTPELSRDEHRKLAMDKIGQ